MSDDDIILTIRKDHAMAIAAVTLAHMVMHPGEIDDVRDKALAACMTIHDTICSDHGDCGLRRAILDIREMSSQIAAARQLARAGRWIDPTMN